MDGRTSSEYGHELELGQKHVPISTSGGPVLDNFPAGQVEHPA